MATKTKSPDSPGVTPEIPFITAYGPKRKISITFDPAEGRTKQEFKNECDINVIMKRYEKTGVLEFIQRQQPQYADTTGRDYQAAMELVSNAQSAFEELPSSLRERFENDPAKLLDFVHDDENMEEAIELGLLDPKLVAARATALAAAAAPPAAPQAAGAAENPPPLANPPPAPQAAPQRSA